MLSSELEKPLFLVMHGGSGSTDSEIKLAVDNGVVKMNIDTDTQWAFWDGVRAFEAENKAYLQGQIGNPKGADKPNKKFYDPRVWVRKGQESLMKRVGLSMEKLGSKGRYSAEDGKGSTQVAVKKGKGGVDAISAMVGGLAVGVAVGFILAKK